MEWIFNVILLIAVLVLFYIVGTQKERFQKPISGDFNDLHNFLGVTFDRDKNDLDFTNGKASPFGGIKTFMEMIQAILNQLGLLIDSDGNITTEEGSLFRRVSGTESTVQDLMFYLGVAFDKDGKVLNLKQGLSKTLADLKVQCDEMKALLDLKAGYSDLNGVIDSVTALQERLEYIRKSAGLLEDWEKLAEALEISDEQAKMLVEKEYKDLSAIAGKDELDFIKSCGLEVETASAIYAKAKELTEKAKAKELTEKSQG